MAPMTEREKIAHLLRRFGLGASEAEMEYYGKDGFKGAIDKLLNYESVEDKFIPIEAFRNEQNNNVPMPLLIIWWIARLAGTHRPLQEKMTLFWHDHFATSGQKVTAVPMMVTQNELLREHATGNFKTMLTEVSKDPAMLFWLDNQFNVKGKPNENFAREIMELFTLGVGNVYTEKDIQEAARAFTGWTIGRRAGRPAQQSANGRLRAGTVFQFNQAQHDNGEKTVLGSTGDLNGDDVIAILCGKPQTAQYLTHKIWEWFVYEKPEKRLVDRFAQKFLDSGLEIKVLLRAIMESPEFVSEKATRAVYKNPVDFCVATLRQLGVGEFVLNSELDAEGRMPRQRLAPIAAAAQAMKSMGMELFMPPDVAGWEGGASWISSATMVERMGWADRMFPIRAPGQQASRRAAFNFPIGSLISADPTPENLVKTMVSVFDAPLSQAKQDALLAAARKHGTRYTTTQSGQAAANAVAKLIFGSPEFQFA